MSNTIHFIEKIREFIAKGDLKLAIQHLFHLLKDSPLLDEAVQQSARYNNVMQQIRLGLVDFNSANIVQNQINKGVLDLLREIEEQEQQIPAVKLEVERYAFKIALNSVENSTITAGGNVNIGHTIQIIQPPTEPTIEELLEKVKRRSLIDYQEWLGYFHRRFNHSLESGLEPYLIIPSRSKDIIKSTNLLSEVVSAHKNLKQKHILLLGKGGSGKSVAMIRLWEHYLNTAEQSSLYLELRKYNQGRDENLLLKTIASHYFDNQISQVEKHFTNQSVVLLLDGYNEVAENFDLLCDEITRLTKYPKLQIVLASRFDYKPHSVFNHFTIVQLTGLDDDQIRNFLKKYEVPFPNYLHNATLTNPFNLAVYLALQKQENYHLDDLIWKEIIAENQLPYYLLTYDSPEHTGTLMTHYCHRLLGLYLSDTLAGKEESYQKEKLAYATFILFIIVPQIGFWLTQSNNSYLIAKDELIGRLDKTILSKLKQVSYRQKLIHLYPAFSFLSESNKNEQWQANSILHFLQHTLLILNIDYKGFVEFFHQNFRDYFAAIYILNELNWHNNRVRSWWLPIYRLPKILKPVIPFTIQSMVSEVALEFKQPTVYQNGKWIKPNFPQSILEISLDKLKGIFSEDLLENEIRNLINMLIIGRSGDLAGLNLNNLLLSGVSFYGLNLSKCGLRGNCVTTFKGSQCRAVDFFQVNRFLGYMTGMKWCKERDALQIEYENGIKWLKPFTNSQENKMLPLIRVRDYSATENYYQFNSIPANNKIATVHWNHWHIATKVRQYKENRHNIHSLFFSNWFEYISLGRISEARYGSRESLNIIIWAKDSVRMIAVISANDAETFLISKDCNWVVITKHSNKNTESENVGENDACTILIYRIPDTYHNYNSPRVTWYRSSFPMPEERLEGIEVKMGCSVILSAFHPFENKIITTNSDNTFSEIDLETGRIVRRGAFQSSHRLILNYAPDGQSFFATSGWGELFEYSHLDKPQEKVFPPVSRLNTPFIINQLAFKTNEANEIESIFFGMQGINKVWEKNYATQDTRLIFEEKDFRYSKIDKLSFSQDYTSFFGVGSMTSLHQYCFDGTYRSIIPKNEEVIFHIDSSAKGEYVAVFANKKVQIIDVFSRVALHNFEDGDCKVAFNPIYNEFIAINADVQNDKILFLGKIGGDIKTIYNFGSVGYNSPVFSPSGNSFAVYANSKIFYWKDLVSDPITVDVRYFSGKIIFLKENRLLLAYPFMVLDLDTLEVEVLKIDLAMDYWRVSSGGFHCKIEPETRELIYFTEKKEVISEELWSLYETGKIRSFDVKANWNILYQYNLKNYDLKEIIRFTDHDCEIADIDPVNKQVLCYASLTFGNRYNGVTVRDFDGNITYHLPPDKFKDAGFILDGVVLPQFNLRKKSDYEIEQILASYGGTGDKSLNYQYNKFCNAIRLLLQDWHNQQMKREDKKGRIFRALRFFMEELWNISILAFVGGAVLYGFSKFIVNRFWPHDFYFFNAIILIFAFLALYDLKYFRSLYESIFTENNNDYRGRYDAEFIPNPKVPDIF